jgi:hypothetical protein
VTRSELIDEANGYQLGPKLREFRRDTSRLSPTYGCQHTSDLGVMKRSIGK